MKALILDAENKTATVQNICRPIPCSGEVLIKVEAVALNPIDALLVAHPIGATGRVVGSDFAGRVVSLGDSHAAAQGSCMDLGDRVAGFVQGANSVNERPGAFAEFVVSPWDLLWKPSEKMSLEQAATMNLCGLTAAQALFYRLGLEAPSTWLGMPERPAGGNEGNGDITNILIYGASTSVGLYAAQLVHRSAEASGRKIRLIGTASQKRFDMLYSTSYSYDHLIDYNKSDWPERVLALTDGKGIQYAYDCIAEGESVQLVCRTLAKGAKLATVRSKANRAFRADNLPTEPIYGAVWEGLGETIQYMGFSVPSPPEARAFAVSFFRWLCDGGKLEPNPIRVMPGGLEKIAEDGFQLLGSGGVSSRQHSRTEAWMKPVSAEKLVYKIDG